MARETFFHDPHNNCEYERHYNHNNHHKTHKKVDRQLFCLEPRWSFTCFNVCHFVPYRKKFLHPYSLPLQTGPSHTIKKGMKREKNKNERGPMSECALPDPFPLLNTSQVKGTHIFFKRDATLRILSSNTQTKEISKLSFLPRMFLFDIFNTCLAKILFRQQQCSWFGTWHSFSLVDEQRKKNKKKFCRNLINDSFLRLLNLNLFALRDWAIILFEYFSSCLSFPLSSIHLITTSTLWDENRI